MNKDRNTQGHNTDRDNEGRFTSGNDSRNAGSRNQQNDTSGRGFAGMDKDKQREAARKGGEASHGGQGRSTSRDEE